MKTTASRASAVSQTRGFGDLLYDKAGARPSLDLDFAGTSSLRDKITGDHLVDYTKTSQSTFINSEGLIESTYANYAGASVSLNENDWFRLTQSNTGVIQDNTDGVYTPRGQLAKILLPNQSGNQPQHSSSGLYYAPRLAWNNALPQAGLTVTKSIYAKMQTGGPRYISHNGWAGAGVSTVHVKFDLQEGVVQGDQIYYPDTTITRNRTSWGINDEGGGWYRCWVTITDTSAHPSMSWVINKDSATGADDFYYDDNNWDINKGVYVANAQFNIGQLKDYVPTLGNVQYSPRFTHERVETGNLITKSNQIYDWGSNSGGSVNAADIQSYAHPNPVDGKFNAYKFKKVTGSTIKTGVTINGRKTVSVYVKPISNPCIVQLMYQLSGYSRANFDLINKTTGGAGTRTIHEASNGWLRLEWTPDAGSGDSSGIEISAKADNLNASRNSGSSTNEFYVYGTQVETNGNGATASAPSIDTFTSRASSATYVDSAGLVKTSAVNKIHNSDFVNSWARDAGLSNSNHRNDVENPFGKIEFQKVLELTNNNTSSQGVWYQTGVGKGTGLLSVYAKANTFSNLNFGGQTPNQTISFNLTNGTINSTSGTTGAIESVGNGWYRCSVNITSNTDWFIFQPHQDGATRVGARMQMVGPGSIFLYGVMLESPAPQPSDFVENLTASTVSSPRYSHDPETLTPTGLYLEPAATNVCKAPLFFDNTGNIRWNSTTNTSFTANAAIAPDGTQTATLVKPNDTNSFPYVSGGNASATYVWSGFFKSAGYRYVHLWQHKSNSSKGIIFDIIDGTITHNFSGNQTGFIQKYPNGWFRIGVKETASNFNGNFGFTLNKHPDGTNVNIYGRNTDLDDFDSGVYAWGLNRTEGKYLSSPIIHTVFADVTRAADVYTSTPNLTETFEPRGLLIEEARTNIVPYSEDFSQSNWNKNHTNLAGQVTSPMGDNTAYNVVPIDNSTYHRINLPFTATTNTYTGSVFVKPNGYRYLHLRLEGGSVNDVGHGFDLQEGIGITGRYNGSLSLSSTSHSIEKYPNGWFKVSVTGNLTSGTGYMGVQISNSATSTAGDATGNSTLGMYVWGAQLETGSFPTSYIPTSGSSATRAADIASISGDNFGTYRTNILSQSDPILIGHTPTNQSSERISSYNTNGAEIEPYAALSPDGKYNAAKLTFTNKYPSGEANIQWNISNPSPASGTNHFSFYAKTISGTATIRIKNGANSTTANGGDFTVTDQWQRFSRQSSGGQSRFGISNYFDSQIGTSILIWGFQFEEGVTEPTNFIPTTSSFTSRLGNATYVDSNGLIKTAYRNLIRYSQKFDTAWSINNGTITANTDIAPDGTLTAYKYVPNTSNTSTHQFFISNGLEGALSIFAKYDGGLTHVTLTSFDANDASRTAAVSFNLVNGSIKESNNATGEIRDAGNGWYRCIVYPSSNTDQNYFVVHPHNGGNGDTSDHLRVTYAGNNSDGILIWGAMQTNNILDAGEYTANADNTLSGAPRYSHDPETLVPTGLYLEPAATNHQMVLPTNTVSGVTQNGVANVVNHLLPSDYNYYGTSSVLYSQDVTAPDGTDTTLKVAFSGLQNNVNHNYLKIGKATGTLNAGTYTFSFFIKSDNANVRDYIGPDYDGRVGGIGQQTAQANPWVSGHNNAANWKLIDYPNGWIRAYVNFTLSSTITNIWNSGIYWLLAGGNTQTDLNYKTFYLWGFQLEAGSYPSSFIGSSVASAVTTRAADTYTSTATTVLDRDGGNKEAWYNHYGPQTYLLEHQRPKGAWKRIWIVGTDNNASGLSPIATQVFWRGSAAQPERQFIVDAGTQFQFMPTLSDQTHNYKYGVAMDVNDAQAFDNGALSGTDTSVTLPTGIQTNMPDKVTIGVVGNNPTTYMSNSFARITYWKTRLPNVALIQISNK